MGSFFRDMPSRLIEEKDGITGTELKCNKQYNGLVMIYQ
jgi:hypothetical protein